MFKYKFLLIAGLALFFVACDDLTELNVDPNNPTDVPVENLVTESQFEMNDMLWSRAYNAEWTMLLVQQWAQNEYGEEGRYTVDGNDFNGVWLELYANVLNELSFAEEMINEDESLTAEQKANQLAIVNILRVHAFHNITDAFGDVPFSEALNGDEFPLPAYDDQESIYKSLLASLEASLKSMFPSAPGFGPGDIVYGGDASLWRKLGNSLMLRIAMRMVDVDEAAATPYINQAAGDLISSNDENALFVFSTEANIANPLWRDVVLGNRDDFVVTDVLVQNLKEMGDPRLDAYAKPNNSGEIVGMPPGLTDGEAFALNPTTSRPSDAVRAADAPAVIMDYAEVQFLLAEAYQRGILTGDAADAYAKGVTASMNYWGITDQAAIDEYITNNPYDAGNWKESLGWQKWIAFYMNGPQAWAEWRRLDYPQLEVPEAATNPVIPVRLPYPIDEQTRNSSSLGAVTDNPNDLSTKMWWDVN